MDVRVGTDKCTRGHAVGGVRAVGAVADYQHASITDRGRSIVYFF